MIKGSGMLCRQKGARMFKDLVKKNRSTRGYDESRPVTKEELLEVLLVLLKH